MRMSRTARSVLAVSLGVDSRGPSVQEPTRNFGDIACLKPYKMGCNSIQARSLAPLPRC